jgi:glycosyltransferase involved in cell wall biosynthesis
VRYIRAHDIRVLHAHSSTIIIARLAAAFAPHPAVIWHAHYGRYAEDRRPVKYRLATIGIAGVVTVNQELADWCARRLHVAPKSIWYIANPAFAEPIRENENPELPGIPGARIICVANFRPEKDHFTLLHAMTSVIRAQPTAHLMIAGKCNDTGYLQRLRAEIPALGLSGHVTILGERHDIPAILRKCDIGVLSSVSEGLPMSLLEYATAGLAAVATDAGQCPEVLDHGRAGILVPHSNPEQMASGLIDLLQHSERRRTLGARFQNFVNNKFNADRIIGQFCEIYDNVSGYGLQPAPTLVGSVD